MPPRYAPLIVFLLVPNGLLAQSLEPVAAQGPSARVVQPEPSAYQRQEPEIEFPTTEVSEIIPPVAPTEETDSARRPSFGGSNRVESKSSRNIGERSNAMLQDWAKSSGVTAAAALAFVVGLFMLLSWAVKRGMPQSAQVLPAEAVRILGRVPLGSRQFGHLLQLGNKLVLVSVSQAGVEKLAEIDDPQEVVRMIAVCSKTSGKGSQKEFEEIFGQFAKEKTQSGFLGSEVSTTTGGRNYA